MELDREKLQDEGARLAPLVAAWHWIDRRVERTHYLDDLTARREMTISFRLPAEARPSGKRWGRRGGARTYCVPLTFISKDAVTQFDFEDERGRKLPLLTAREKGVIATGLLTWMAGAAIDRDPADGWKSLCGEIKQIAEAKTEAEGNELLACFLARVERGAGAYAQLRSETRVARAFRSLLTDLAGSYLVVVPLAGRTGVARIVRFSYHEKVTSRNSYEGNLLRRVAQACLYAIRSLGWQPKQFEFATPAVGRGGSYHFEMSAPPGLMFVGGRLKIWRREASGAQCTIDAVPATYERGSIHMMYRGASPGVSGTAHVRVQPRNSTLVRSAVVISLASTVLLAVGQHFLQRLAVPAEGLSVPAERLAVSTAGRIATASSVVTRHATADAVAPLLFVIPTALSLYVTTTSEHHMTTAVLHGVRMLCLAAATPPFVIACLVAFGASSAPLGTVWHWGLRWAIVVAAMLFVTMTAVWLRQATPVRRWRRRRDANKMEREQAARREGIQLEAAD